MHTVKSTSHITLINTLWLAVTLASSIVQAAPPPDIVVRLSTAAVSFRGGQNIPLTVTVTNQSSVAISLLKWALPTTVADGSMLSVTQNNLPVTYLGALYKHHTPLASDYVTLAPWQKISHQIELTRLFDLSTVGTYAVEYNFHSGHRIAYATNTSTQASALTTQQFALDSLKSLPVHLTIEVTPKELMQQNDQSAATVTKQAATYTGCSTPQQSNLVTAVANATNYAASSYNHLLANPNGSVQYSTWFGVYDAGRKQTVNSHFANERSAFTIQTMVFNCTCSDTDTFAYVYPGDPYKIYLCGAFWSAPDRGTDSKAGTLIHEMSHFTVVAGTQDYVYGSAGAAALAISNPANAIMNADNHEYFAESIDLGSSIITPSAGTGGSVVPNTPQTVGAGTTKTFTVTANAGYTSNTTVGGTCPRGSWSGSIWTTGPITANCTVTFSFTSQLPTATTNAPGNITATSVTLYGGVASNGATTSASFNFGPTTSYGTNITANPAQINSTTTVIVTAGKTGLACNTLYHYRVKATNSFGTTYGVDKNFTTAGCSQDVQLTSGVPLSNQSVAEGAWKYYYISVPAGTTSLTAKTTNVVTGVDLDLYVRPGSKPTATDYVCRPYTTNGNETCWIPSPSAGTWWIGVYGYTVGGSYTVTVTQQ